jgi:hypothetical protein
VISQEHPHWDCRHLDLTGENLVRDGEAVLFELGIEEKERFVAYRQGVRKVLRLKKEDFSKLKNEGVPFKQGGFYLLTGGLGGIGIEIARLLLREYQVHLLIVGRSKAENRKELLDSLRKEGGAVRYESLDICDGVDLEKAVVNATAEWGIPFEGVIHLAGGYHGRFLREETRESFDRVIAPKVYGTLNLYQLMMKQSGRSFVTFSSAAECRRVGGAQRPLRPGLPDHGDRGRRRAVGLAGRPSAIRDPAATTG